MNKEKKIPGHILSLFIILLSISGVCLLMYKAQFRFNLHQPIEYVMMTTHKPTGTITLSSDSPVLTETFTCTVPELKMFTLEGTAKNKNSDARLFITLANADSGEIYYQAEHTLSVFRATKKKELTCNLPQPVSASENAHLQLKLKLINGDKTVLSFTSNEKQALIQEFNNDTNSHTNIIYSFTYGDNNFMLYFYIALCVILLLFIIMTFYLIIIRQMTVQKFYVPVALFLGLIFQCLVTVHGVPDEPTHFDAAYSLSNKMLFVKNTETPGSTIYKRRCDAQLSDMLSNGLETNSYYQLLFHSFEFASDTDLIEISYVSTSGLVPAVVYVPAAIGLSIGRLLHLSPMLTFQLESKEFALSVLEKVRMIKFAESLGGVETLITYPTTQTHADVPKEIRERNGITEATLRLSVGIEDAQDLLDEFEKVFAETEEELYGGKKS